MNIISKKTVKAIGKQRKMKKRHKFYSEPLRRLKTVNVNNYLAKLTYIN